jgi:hypothetical protein
MVSAASVRPLMETLYHFWRGLRGLLDLAREFLKKLLDVVWLRPGPNCRRHILHPASMLMIASLSGSGVRL